MGRGTAPALCLHKVSRGAHTVINSFFFNSGLWGYWHCGHSWSIVPASGDSEDDCGEAGETEVLGENLSQRLFCPSQIPTWPDPGLNPGRRGGKPATNRMSYGAAWLTAY
jgi:hypothetical protein